MNINIPYKLFEIKKIEDSKIQEINDLKEDNICVDITNIDQENNFNEILSFLKKIHDQFSKKKNILFLTDNKYLKQNLIKMKLSCSETIETTIEEPKIKEEPIENYSFLNERLKYLRSGSNKHVQNKNVLIYDSVRSGGELICDGSIIVLGTASGKLIAGVTDPNSYILCQDYQGELVSINGVYEVGKDTQEYFNESVLIELNEDGTKLIFNKIKKLI